jgi:hypothetical protein
LDNYTKLANDNLKRLFDSMPSDLQERLPGDQDGERYTFTAFGKLCTLSPDGISLDRIAPPGVIGILLSLYALHASREAQVLEPLRAFKEFPNSAPYVGAFTSHTEGILVPEVQRIKEKRRQIVDELSGQAAPSSVSGDFAFVVRPLPKISLCYIFYEADEDFPASVTCLFSNNANTFMPMDGLADVGEYTSKRIRELLTLS